MNILGRKVVKQEGAALELVCGRIQVTRGLGLQMAEALGSQGARILLSARKSKELRSAQAHLAAQGIDADWIAADASMESDIVDLAEQAIASSGRVDILVNLRLHGHYRCRPRCRQCRFCAAAEAEFFHIQQECRNA